MVAAINLVADVLKIETWRFDTLFAGIPKEGLTFLRSLARNNRREWFQERKEVFETKLKAPFLELVNSVNHELHKFAPEHVNEASKAVFRIYRDTRFSNDKTPYKTHIGAIFPKRGLPKHSGGAFYFEIAPKAIGLGSGWYMLEPEHLLAMRTWIAENHKDFARALGKAEKVLGPLQGESLQRVPKGFSPEHPAADLIKRKQWYFWTELDPELACSPRVVSDIVRHFRAGAETVTMLNAPLQGQKKRMPERDWLL